MIARTPPVSVAALAAAGFFVLLGAACGKKHEPPSGERFAPGEEPAPSASVVSIGVVLGTCPDVAVCESECDAGSADRCRRLAATYALGRGVPKDEARATAIYEHACDMNDPTACVFAGQMHEYAHGVPKDDALAARFYQRACDARWKPGCYNLAVMYEHGRGVPLDRAKAAALYDGACAAGSKSACDHAAALRAPPAPGPDAQPPATP